nr:MAG TPA: hypothetical protein [Caudoviricetes sp.]
MDHLHRRRLRLSRLRLLPASRIASEAPPLSDQLISPRTERCGGFALSGAVKLRDGRRFRPSAGEQANLNPFHEWFEVDFPL